MNRSFLLLLLIALACTATAQTTIYIGNGGTTNAPNSYPAPYGNWWWGARHQIMVSAAELSAAGMATGNIESLALDVAITNNVPLQDFTIGIKSTLATDVTNGWEGGMTTVWGPMDYTDIVGWNIHTFSNPFFWDGTSNLLIEICFNNSSSTANALTYFSSTTFQSVRYRVANNGFVCPGGFNSQTSSTRPNLQFVWNPPEFPPVAAFNADPIFSCNGTVNFTDLSDFDPTSWQWDFGDGNTDTVQNPTNTYTTNGNYTVTLIATNQFGSDTLVAVDVLTVDLSSIPPIPADCIPQTLGTQAGFGISLFEFGSISNPSGDAATEGYADFTCFQANVVAGQSYLMNVVADMPTTHNIRAWIDFNNDGILDAITEEVLAENSTLQATTMVNIPGSAVLNTPLRLRVSADYDFSPIPGPCTDLQFGQAEDYVVIIEENLQEPIAEFSASPLITCDGAVQFTDLSMNAPNSWLWDFGDSNNSTDQNPLHTYTNDGTYTVELIAYNANGSDTIIYLDLVVVNTAGAVVPANCIPSTLAFCCDYGIYSVDFNTISNTSANASEGYRNFSCQHQTTVTEGNNYLISISTGSINAQDTRVWIDLNNDGDLDASEMVYEAFNEFNPAGLVNIPGGAVTNTPLRMRIISDVIGNVVDACDDQNFGQTEDYSIIIEAITVPPVAFFTSNLQTTCDGDVQFLDLSTNAPNQWLWDFGDATTGNDQNPLHTYTTPGIYSVSLTATNNVGNDTHVENNYIEYMTGPLCDTLLLPPNGPGGVYTSCQGVVMDDGGYEDYSPGANGWITIAPTNAETVTLFFHEFEYEPNNDFLIIYDGPGITSPIIGTYSGIGVNFLPNNGVISSTGPAITIQQETSFGFITFAGFLANWDCTLTGIEENDLENVRVYPNPATDILTIDFSQSNAVKANITISNIIGEVILSKSVQKSSSTYKIDIGNMQRGVYLLTLETQSGSMTKKIVIN